MLHCPKAIREKDKTTQGEWAASPTIVLLSSLSLKGNVSLSDLSDIKMRAAPKRKSKLGFLSGGLNRSFVTEVFLVWLLTSQKEKCFGKATWRSQRRGCLLLARGFLPGKITDLFGIFAKFCSVITGRSSLRSDVWKRNKQTNQPQTTKANKRISCMKNREAMRS